MPVGQSRTSNSELEMIEKQTIKQMYNQPGYLSSDNYVQKCPLIRCTLISVSVTNCPLALLPNFNITRFQEYRQLLKVSPKCCFQGREDEGREPIPCPKIVFFFLQSILSFAPYCESYFGLMIPMITNKPRLLVRFVFPFQTM